MGLSQEGEVEGGFVDLTPAGGNRTGETVGDIWMKGDRVNRKERGQNHSCASAAGSIVVFMKQCSRGCFRDHSPWDQAAKVQKSSCRWKETQNAQRCFLSPSSLWVSVAILCFFVIILSLLVVILNFLVFFFILLGILEKLCGRFVSLFGCFCLFMIPLSLFLVVLCFFVVLSVFDILQLKPTGLLTPWVLSPVESFSNPLILYKTVSAVSSGVSAVSA